MARLIVHPAINWRKHPMMSVTGCIDSHGSIRAKESKKIESHSPELSKGKRWRWLIWPQEFQTLPPKTVAEMNDPQAFFELSDEEYFLVKDWLMRHGYADDGVIA